MQQTREEMQKKTKKASNIKILRRQIEMLTEYSRTSGIERSPEACQAIVELHKELTKAESIILMFFLVSLFGFDYLVKRIPIKGIKLIKR